MKEKGGTLRKPDPAELASTRRSSPVAPGRVGTFAVLGAVVGSVPLPWLPDNLQKRVRGALAQDVASRHGLSLSTEARDVLAEPAAGGEAASGVMSQAFSFVTRKVLVRFGPLGFLPPVRAWLNTFVLGHLFARYLQTWRTEPAVRIDVHEARTIRRAIDRAILHVLTAYLVAAREDTGEAAAEDLRDEITQIIDGVLIATAGVPSWLVRRLNASFDDTLAMSPHG